MPRPVPSNQIRGGPQALARAQVQMRRDAQTIFLYASGQIGQVLRRAADETGVIPTRQRRTVQQDAGNIITRVFVGPDGRNPFAADGVTALALYPMALMRQLAWVQADAVRIHHDWLRRNVPDDVFAWLANGRQREAIVSEQTRSEQLREMYRDLLVDTGNLDYDPAHTFVNPDDGYTLSDRIWRTGTTTRVKVDQMIADGIQAGDGAEVLARRLEQFLTPGRAKVRTLRPYGTDASFDAMRLARTEITAAFGRASMAAARANPYVTMMWWKLSPSHPEPDICDAYEGGSPYALTKVPDYPAHPQCLCSLVPLVEQAPARVTADLREMVQSEREELRPYLNPAQIDGFTQWLLGDMTRVLNQLREMDILRLAGIVVPF